MTEPIRITDLLRLALYLIKHLLVLVLIKLPLQLLAIPILGIVLLFVPRSATKLPAMLKWFDNHESYFSIGNSQDDGLSGPDYIKSKWKDPDGYLARFNWLALRNPVNYFQYAILGKTRSTFMVIDSIKGDPLVGTHDWNTRGYYFLEVTNHNETLWELYIVAPIYKEWHFRLRAGWKISFNSEPGEQLQWVLAITPLKKL